MLAEAKAQLSETTAANQKELDALLAQIADEEEREAEEMDQKPVVPKGCEEVTLTVCEEEGESTLDRESMDYTPISTDAEDDEGVWKGGAGFRGKQAINGA